MLKHGKKIVLLRDGSHIVNRHIIGKGRKINRNIARNKNIAVRETIKSGEGVGDSLVKHSREQHKKIKEGAAKFKKEFQKNVTTAILAAFGFIIALVWRDAIQDIINQLILVFNLVGTGYFYRLITAIVITIVCVIGVMYVSRFSETEYNDDATIKK